MRRRRRFVARLSPAFAPTETTRRALHVGHGCATGRGRNPCRRRCAAAAEHGIDGDDERGSEEGREDVWEARVLTAVAEEETARSEALRGGRNRRRSPPESEKGTGRRWLPEASRLDSLEEHVEGDEAQLLVVGELPGRARIDGISPATVSAYSAG